MDVWGSTGWAVGKSPSRKALGHQSIFGTISTVRVPSLELLPSSLWMATSQNSEEISASVSHIS